MLKLIPHQLSEEMNDRFLPNLRNVVLCFGGVLSKELPASSIEHGWMDHLQGISGGPHADFLARSGERSLRLDVYTNDTESVPPFLRHV